MLFAALLFSCKNKDAFTISGTISNPGSLKRVSLIEATANGITVIDSTNLSDQGKFQFTHSTPYENLYSIRAGGALFDFVAKNGDDIEFSTNLTDPTKAYTIKGSEESGKLQDFNKLSDQLYAINNQLSHEYTDKAAAIQKGPNSAKQAEALIDYYRPLLKKNYDAYNLAVLKFMNDNKNSLAGFYAALTVDSVKYESQLVNYADEIKSVFPNNPAVQQFVQMKMAIKPVTVGQKAPDFTTTGIDGKPVKLSDYKGKYVILDFWASWCGPCRMENPNVVKQYALYKDKGLNILSISLDVKKEDWEQAVKNDKLTWAQASDLKYWNGPTGLLYHVFAIPSNFIINPDGVIIAKNVTGQDLEDFLKKTFSKSN